MLLNPAVFIQIAVSVSCTVLLAAASVFALRVIRGWDIKSGSETQLRLERRTYLISTIVGFCFVCGAVQLLYFIQTCESISPQFVGAMCATGVLNANPYGWPVLILKIIIFFGSVTWLLLNHLDKQGRDYPLIRIKYGLLLALLPLYLFETVHLYLFFAGLDPDLIVSCCGSMFSVSAEGVAGQVSSIPPKQALFILAGSGILIPAAWGISLKFRTGIYIYGFAGVAAFAAALVCLISLVGPYIYEHPHHHCPFCMLKSGYDFAGFILYIPLFSGTAAGIGAAAVLPCARFESIRPMVPKMAQTLVHFSFACFAVFYLSAAVYIMKSNLTMAFRFI